MNLKTVAQYAAMHTPPISRMQVYNRIEKKLIKSTKRKYYAGILIDADKYPPLDRQKPGKKTFVGK